MKTIDAMLLALAAAAAAGAAPPAERPMIELRAAPVEPEMRGGMRRWQIDTRELLRPVLSEWRAVARSAAGTWAGESLEAGCRRLGAALGGLDRRRLPPAPDPAASLYLDETLSFLTEAAASCSRGAVFLTDWRLRQAAGSWSRLAARLRLYGVDP